jgi:SAM-dependent methyltransferase
MSTAALFERLAARYDELWTETAVGRAQRNAVWRVVDRLFGAGDCVLDIGCGTGEDAARLGSRGVSVSGIDASAAMVARARARGVMAEVGRVEELFVGHALACPGERSSPSAGFHAAQQIGHEAEKNPPAAATDVYRSGLKPVADAPNGQSPEASSARLDKLKHVPQCAARKLSAVNFQLSAFERHEIVAACKEYGGIVIPFDGAISNFGALNCVEDLAGVARALGVLVRPGGYVAICTMGRFCVWETLYYGLRLDFKRALRRLAGRAGEIRYPTVRQLHADFAADFDLVRWSGVGMLVPPSYVKLPAGIVNLLARLDRLPFLRACADHRLLVFKRK